jgi:hypothetical protein
MKKITLKWVLIALFATIGVMGVFHHDNPLGALIIGLFIGYGVAAVAVDLAERLGS